MLLLDYFSMDSSLSQGKAFRNFSSDLAFARGITTAEGMFWTWVTSSGWPLAHWPVKHWDHLGKMETPPWFWHEICLSTWVKASKRCAEEMQAWWWPSVARGSRRGRLKRQPRYGWARQGRLWMRVWGGVASSIWCFLQQGKYLSFFNTIVCSGYIYQTSQL